MISDSRYLSLKNSLVNCIITSPPYWSLRKYDIPDLVWDGDKIVTYSAGGEEFVEKVDSKKCEHEWGKKIDGKKIRGMMTNQENAKEVFVRDENDIHLKSGQFCLKCSAWRGQLGLEPTIDLYLKHLMQIMDECWRVLKDTGVMFVNLGDSFSGGKGQSNYGFQERRISRTFNQAGTVSKMGETRPSDGNIGIPPKSLCLIPERFAIAMVERGWILRNKIIWHKPNCMPASVKDRFMVDFEPVFFFVKSRKYWFEQQYEPQIILPNGKLSAGTGDRTSIKSESPESQNAMASKWTSGRERYLPQGRNRRCVWTIPTQPYPESHFATFPEALIEPMIRAGCPQFVCKKCGKAREKILKSKFTSHQSETDSKYEKGSAANRMSLLRQAARARGEEYHQEVEEIGFTDCGCNADFEPGIVLDPFCGSGTVMRVAEKLNRIGIGFDLGYADLQRKRIANVQKEIFG